MKHSYFAKIGILLIVVALVAAIISCNGVATYSLTMAANPDEGGTAIDVTNTSPYARATKVDIKAVPDPCYRFVNWQATAGTFGNANNATTTFTMPAEDVTVTANFEITPLDHATGYYVNEATPQYIGEVVYLEDQFVSINATVESAAGFCNPVEKQHDGLTPISNPDHHLTVYYISYDEEPQSWQVVVKNQFGNDQELTVVGPYGLAVPTQKVEPGGHEPPLCLDHYLLYEVIEGTSVDVTISLDDQFGEEPEVGVYEPLIFANPVQKTIVDTGEVTEIMNPEVHGVGYYIEGEYFAREVEVVNQFGEQSLDVSGPYFLVVPSEKISWEQLPDHYKFYEVDGKTALPVEEVVQLVDQFGTFNATVGKAEVFGNPVEKEHDGVTLTPISDPNRHYTLYELVYDWEVDSVTRSVEVSNQFQDKVELTVWGPVMLAVPTQKEGHEMVECLNHYLVYVVDDADYYEFSPVEDVNLKDQFIPDGEDVTVGGPWLFANPVKKTVVETGDVSAIEDPDLHWVLYDIYDEEAPSIGKKIQIDNQFGSNQTLDLTYRDTLAVPSQKNVPPTPPLDHFKCYNATGPAPGPEGVSVNLVDQFHDYYFDAEVLDPMMFCNPVDKWHDGVQKTNRNDDNHLTVYKIWAETDWWTVTVDNQFNDAAVPQTLTVMGPVALAVPTQKVIPNDHGMPKYLDHYLLYEVWEPVPVNVTVDLDDQFEGTAPGVTVTKPVYFANPVVKGYVDHAGLWDPEEHLVFYEISTNDEFLPLVTIRNQFFPDEGVPLNLFDNWELLAVPSVKVAWDIAEY